MNNNNIAALVQVIIDGRYTALALLYDEVMEIANNDLIRAYQLRQVHSLIGIASRNINMIIEVLGKNEVLTIGEIPEQGYSADAQYNFTGDIVQSESARSTMRREIRRVKKLIEARLKEIFWRDLIEPADACGLIESIVKKYSEK